MKKLGKLLVVIYCIRITQGKTPPSKFDVYGWLTDLLEKEFDVRIPPDTLTVYIRSLRQMQFLKPDLSETGWYELESAYSCIEPERIRRWASEAKDGESDVLSFILNVIIGNVGVQSNCGDVPPNMAKFQFARTETVRAPWMGDAATKLLCALVGELLSDYQWLEEVVFSSILAGGQPLGDVKINFQGGEFRLGDQRLSLAIEPEFSWRVCTIVEGLLNESGSTSGDDSLAPMTGAANEGWAEELQEAVRDVQDVFPDLVGNFSPVTGHIEISAFSLILLAEALNLPVEDVLAEQLTVLLRNAAVNVSTLQSQVGSLRMEVGSIALPSSPTVAIKTWSYISSLFDSVEAASAHHIVPHRPAVLFRDDPVLRDDVLFDTDWLGAYFPGFDNCTGCHLKPLEGRRIEIYPKRIRQCYASLGAKAAQDNRELKFSEHDLTLVVVVHEIMHALLHLGIIDIDDAQQRILEPNGLEEFLGQRKATFSYLGNSEKPSPVLELHAQLGTWHMISGSSATHTAAREAFLVLMQYQSPAYQVPKVFRDTHPNALWYWMTFFREPIDDLSAGPEVIQHKQMIDFLLNPSTADQRWRLGLDAIDNIF